MRKSNIKIEKATVHKPNHHIISSDFPKYYPNPNYFASQLGKERIEWLLSHEYQRMWFHERDEWKKRVYPENEENVDVIKAYVASVKKLNPPAPKCVKKERFIMKKFRGIPSKTVCRRPPDDKAMQYHPIKPRKKK